MWIHPSLIDPSSSPCRWMCLRSGSSCVRSSRGYRPTPTSCHALRYRGQRFSSSPPPSFAYHHIFIIAFMSHFIEPFLYYITASVSCKGNWTFILTPSMTVQVGLPVFQKRLQHMTVAQDATLSNSFTMTEMILKTAWYGGYHSLESKCWLLSWTNRKMTFLSLIKDCMTTKLSLLKSSILQPNYI